MVEPARARWQMSTRLAELARDQPCVRCRQWRQRGLCSHMCKRCPHMCRKHHCRRLRWWSLCSRMVELARARCPIPTRIAELAWNQSRVSSSRCPCSGGWCHCSRCLRTGLLCSQSCLHLRCQGMDKLASIDRATSSHRAHIERVHLRHRYRFCQIVNPTGCDIVSKDTRFCNVLSFSIFYHNNSNVN